MPSQTRPASSGSLGGGPTFRDPHLGLDKALCLAPTFHSPSFLTLRMTPLKISVGEGGLRMLGSLAPRHSKTF